MSARDVVAVSLHNHGIAFPTPEEVTDWIVKALTDAGHRILGPGELDSVTVERCAGVADACEAQQEIDNGAADTGGAAFAAQAIRSLIPTQPDAKEANSETWPNGCHAPRSCIRHMDCMYTNCRHEGRPIKAEIEAAIQAKEAPHD